MNLRRPASALILVACQQTPPSPVVLEDDGGWCWFQDERALALGDQIVFGSVASGSDDPARRGDIQLTLWRPADGSISRVELHDRLELDDHDAPALLELSDGRLLAVYAKHGTDKLVRWRRTTSADDRTKWEPERTLTLDQDPRLGVTYSNVHRVRGALVNLVRAKDWDPNLCRSDDEGATWRWVGQVLSGSGRPYLKYVGDGEVVHLVATEQHPRDFDNGLYHGVLLGDEVLDSQRVPVGRVAEDPPAPEDLTRIFAGAPDAVAWPADLELDGDGHPVVAFSVQVDGAGLPRRQGGLDHRLHLARFDGARWEVEEVAHLGTRLYAGEDDYTGLAAIDPDDPNVVYLCTDAHPATGVPLVSTADGLRHYELFRARRSSDGWSFTALTSDSTADNLRPIVTRGTPKALLWLRGELRSYTDYDLEVVGLALDGSR